MSLHTQRRGFTLIELLVVIAIITLIVALLMPAIQKIREESAKLKCKNSLKQLAMACHTYEQHIRSLPPAIQMRVEGSGGTVSNVASAEGQNFGPNWLVLILPYADQGNLYNSVASSVGAYMTTGDSGWRAVIGQRVPLFLCPSDSRWEVPWPGISGHSNWARGNYGCNAFGIHQGSTNGWNGTFKGAVPTYEAGAPWTDPTIPVGTRGAGVMCINYGARTSDIPDGASTTIMIGELRIGASVAPGDVRGTWALGFPGASVLAGQASWDCRTPNNTDTQADDLGPGSRNAPEDGMGACEGCGFQQAQSRSRHANGVNVAMCDGAVKFVRNSVTQNTWWRMNARDDGVNYKE